MLKKLSIISLLILFLPFFQTCSDKNIYDNNILENNPLLELTEIIFKTKLTEKEYHLSLKELNIKKQNAIEDFVKLKKKFTLNGYEMGQILTEDIKNPNWPFLPFFISILINLTIVYYSFKDKPKIILILAILNILFLITLCVILYFENILEDIEQLKIGYYLLTFNLLIIILESNSQLKRKNIR